MSYKPPYPIGSQVPVPKRTHTPSAPATGRGEAGAGKKPLPPLGTSSGSRKHQINGFSPQGLESHADRNGEIRAMKLEGRAQTTAQRQACSSGGPQSAGIHFQAI